MKKKPICPHLFEDRFGVYRCRKTGNDASICRNAVSMSKCVKSISSVNIGCKVDDKALSASENYLG
jgi:hypothetical protein